MVFPAQECRSKKNGENVSEYVVIEEDPTFKSLRASPFIAFEVELIMQGKSMCLDEMSGDLLSCTLSKWRYSE
jgi:hypothetical protein